MKYNFKLTLIVTLLLLVLFSSCAFLIQTYSQNKLNPGCKLLDPWEIDLFALLAAFFLFVEGFYKLNKNKKDRFLLQVPRIFRILIGGCVMVLHIMQIFHG